MKTLENVSETLWIPLFGKARESIRLDSFIVDDKAVEIANLACEKLPELNKWWVDLSMETQALMVWRNTSIDAYVSEFITKHPNATIVNLGAGLCTRFSRVDNGTINWLEFDLPEVKEVWLEFNEETDRHKYYTDSIFEENWLEVVKNEANGPIMFTAEGLLMYFSKEEVASLLQTLSKHFPNGEIVAEIYSKIALKRRHPDVKKTSAIKFKAPWGVVNGKEFEKWNVGVKHLKDDFITNHSNAMKRMPVLNKSMAQLPFFRKVGKMVHLRFETN